MDIAGGDCGMDIRGADALESACRAAVLRLGRVGLPDAV